MSVYTSVSSHQLVHFLSNYAVGKLVGFHGISGGITNTNYTVDTDLGKYVLTLYEHMSAIELDYVLNLQHHLASSGVACAAPVRNLDGEFYAILNHRPAALNHLIAGKIIPTLSKQHCSLIGAEMARFHIAGQGYAKHRVNPRGVAWWVRMQRELDYTLDSCDRQLLASEIIAYQALPLEGLPWGPLHADLFHDNVLFDGAKLGGIIDFDYACNDYLILDLAIAINDCCIDHRSNIDSIRQQALLQAYDKIRPLSAGELTMLPAMYRAAALRFWLSRLYDQAYPLSGELTYQKDPLAFRNMLLSRRGERPV